MPDLTTLENVKTYMQITDTAQDTVLARLITSFSSWFINQVNRGALLQATYTEQRNGQGGDLITTFNWPITAVNSLVIDGVTVPASNGQTPGYTFDSFSIFLKCYRFTRSRGNVEISYQAGYATCPPEIEQAIIDQVAFTLRRIPNLGTTSQSMNGILTTSFSQKDLAPGVQSVIDNFKDKAVVGV